VIRALAAAALGLACAAPAGAQDRGFADRIAAVIKAYPLDGELIVANAPGPDGRPGAVFRHATASPKPGGGAADAPWRWASVTKQVTAILVMQEVERGRLALDAPVARYLPGFRSANAGGATIRHLLQHRAGLPNPDDTAKTAAGVPGFYARDYAGSRDPLTGYCAGPVKGSPGGDWAYNNCDYLVLGALLEAVTGTRYADLVRERIAAPLGLASLGVHTGTQQSRRGFTDGAPEPDFDLSSYGAAAALYGTADDLLRLDRVLLGGRLLSEPARAELWRGDPALGFMALGQWAFDARLAGCAAPVRIVERRGAIGGVEVRNLLLPATGRIAIVFSRRAPFPFGEVWQGKGFTHDLLSALACSETSAP
jgi:D-alanyl-D-alanine carboxypeptidase